MGVYTELISNIKGDRSSGGISNKTLRQVCFSKISTPMPFSEKVRAVELVGVGAQIAFTETLPLEDFCLEFAKGIFSEKILRGSESKDWTWSQCVKEIGTHHPKTLNDKSTSRGITSLAGIPAPRGLVSSKDTSSFAESSGSGNGANINHYRLLSWAFIFRDNVTSIFRLILDESEWLKQGLLELGVSEAQWSELCRQAKEGVNPRTWTIDRHQKQFFFPDPDNEMRDCLLTPVGATSFIGAVENFRRELEQSRREFEKKSKKEKESLEPPEYLPTRATSIGGANPQNAGSLLSDLSGHLHHVKMGFPRPNFNSLSAELYRVLTNSNYTYASDERKALVTLMKREYTNPLRTKESRRSEIISVAESVMRAEVEGLLKLKEKFEELSENRFSQLLGQITKEPKGWIKLLFYNQNERKAYSHTEIEQIAEGLFERLDLYLHTEVSKYDDSDRRLIRDAVFRIVEEAWL